MNELISMFDSDEQFSQVIDEYISILVKHDVIDIDQDDNIDINQLEQATIELLATIQRTKNNGA